MMTSDFDVAIVGAGPAGLQAAIHAARKKVKVCVLGRAGNSALGRADIENYFGVRSMKGAEMLQISADAAREFGAQLLEEDLLTIEMQEGGFRLKTESLKELNAKALVLAPGISRKKLNVEGEKEFHGLGVSYCATCDCNFFKKKTVAVLGDASMAASAALLLREYASKVYWVAREFKASPELTAKVKGTDIEMVQAWPTRIHGDQVVRGMTLDNGRDLVLDGVFIEMGAKGVADLAMEVNIFPDENGYIAVDRHCATETPGVFACGDVTGLPWQLAKAVGEGCVAGLSAAAFVRKEKE
jgi:thioredoxin reductase (NADPH)